MSINKILTRIAAIGLLAFSMATISVLPGTSLPNTQVSAAPACAKQYNAWDKAGQRDNSKTYKPMIECIKGVAKNRCVGKYLQGGPRSEEDKKASCVSWYIDGFTKFGATCNKSTSDENKATCKTGSESRTIYQKNADSTKPDGGSDDNDSGGGSGGSSGGGSADGEDSGGSDKAEAINLGNTRTDYKCGGDNGNGDSTGSISTAINFGCKGKGNALVDLMFAIIRFLSNGVGLVIIASLIWGGIQYSSSRGDPQATAAAVNRFRSVVTALLVFAFAYAIINYLIPGQLLK